MAKNQRIPKNSGSGSGKSAAQRRLEAQRALAAATSAAAAKRRRRWMAFYTPLVALVVVVLVLVLVSVTGGKDHKPANTAAPAAQDVAATVTSVPAGVLDQVGAGTASSPPTAVSGDPLTADGKPRVLYVGAEWCPFCAAERWPLVVALSRFGTFTGLGQTSSDPNDVKPNTPTLTFHGATYTSDYLVFDPVEIEDGDHKPLDALDAADQKLFTDITGGSFPFVDFAGAYVLAGAQYDPGDLAGKTHAEVAAALSDPDSKIAKDVDGSANVITAVLCRSTGNKPANVCTSSGVTAAAASLT